MNILPPIGRSRHARPVARVTGRLAAAAFLAGCAARHGVVPDSVPVAAAWRLVETNASAATAAEGTLTLKGRLEGERVRARAAYAVSPSGAVYLEVGSTASGPVAVVAVDSERATVLLPGSREYVREDSKAAMMERLTGIPVDVRELAAILLGTGVPSGLFEAGETRSIKHGVEVHVRSRALDREARLRLSSSRATAAFCSAHRLVSGELSGGSLGGRALSFRYGIVGKGQAERKVRIERRPGTRLDFVIEDAQPWRNAPDGGRLDLEPPRGFTRLMLSQFRPGRPVLVQALSRVR